MSVFKELALSVWSFKSYRQFVNNKGGKVFGFSALLVGIYILISGLKFFWGFVGFGEMLQDEILNRIPNFVLEDGILDVDGVVMFSQSGNYICINTDEAIDPERAETLFRVFDSVLLMDDTKVMIQSNGEEVQTAYYIDLIGSERYTEDDLKSLVQIYLPYVYVGLALVYLFVIVCQTAAFYIRIVVVSLAVLVIGSLLHMKLLYRDVFKLSVYTRTIPVLVRMLLNLTGLSVPFFWLIDIAVSSFYAYLALYEIREEMRRQSLYPLYGGQSPQQPYSGQNPPQLYGRQNPPQPYGGQNPQQPYSGQSPQQPYGGQNPPPTYDSGQPYHSQRQDRDV